MANQFEIYKCELCGNVIEVLFAGSGGPLSCCGQPMKLMADKAIDGAKEKHVPVIEANGAGCKVKVRSSRDGRNPLDRMDRNRHRRRQAL